MRPISCNQELTSDGALSILFLLIVNVFSLKEACTKMKLTYDTIKYYCNEGLAPNVKRDKNNYRIFDDRDIAWINSLSCLKNCGMSIVEMKEYLQLCLEGKSSMPARQKILDVKKQNLIKELNAIQKSDWKQGFYQDVLDGRTEYYSNLVPVDDEEDIRA